MPTIDAAVYSARVSAVMETNSSEQLWAHCGVFLDRHRVLDRLVELSVQLGKLHKEELDAACVRRGIRTMLKNPLLGQFVIAWSNDDRIIGMMELKKRFETWRNHSDWHIDNFIVYQEFRRHGIGTRLMDYVKQAAALEGVESLWLDVMNVNEEVITYYEKRGFVRQGHLMEFKPPGNGPNPHRASNCQT
jgi:ribosomal protein S18 acetylase RimI-like enzyme